MDDFKKLCHVVCKKCKIDCCKKFDVFFSEYDKNRVRKINKSKNLFDGNSLNTKGKRCLFYNKKDKSCAIHKYRPLDCRIYPYSFWFERGRIELWLDLKCQLSEHLIANKKYYNQVMRIAKKELIHWSEGEIFAYLMSEFDIKKFREQARGKKKKKYYK